MAGQNTEDRQGHILNPSLAKGSSIFVIKRKYTENNVCLHEVLLRLHVLDFIQAYGLDLDCLLSLYLVTCMGAL